MLNGPLNIILYIYILCYVKRTGSSSERVSTALLTTRERPIRSHFLGPTVRASAFTTRSPAPTASYNFT